MRLVRWFLTYSNESNGLKLFTSGMAKSRFRDKWW